MRVNLCTAAILMMAAEAGASVGGAATADTPAVLSTDAANAAEVASLAAKNADTAAATALDAAAVASAVRYPSLPVVIHVKKRRGACGSMASMLIAT